MKKIKSLISLLSHLEICILLVYCLFAFYTKSTINIEILVWVSIITVLCSIFSDFRYCKYGVNAMVLYYMIMSQFGYVFSYSLFGTLANTRMAFNESLKIDNSFNVAVLISVIAVLIYVLFSLNKKKYCINFGGKHLLFKQKKINENYIFVSQLIVLFIQLIICITVYYMFGNMKYSVRSDILAKNYPLTLYWSYFSECSMPLIVAICSSKHIKQAFLIYLPIVIFQFLMGNRGEIMYGALIIIAIFALKNEKTINTKKIIIFAIACVLILPAIASFREGGTFEISNLTNQFASFFSELGFQIIPTKYTVAYITSTGNYQLGATYFFDFVLRITGILGLDNTNLSNSMAKIDNMLPNYGYGLGYSQVAESFYNFGILGIVIEMMILARLALLFEKKIKETKNGDSLIIDVCIAVNLVNITRNKFDSTIIFLIYAFLIKIGNSFFALNKDGKDNRIRLYF